MLSVSGLRFYHLNKAYIYIFMIVWLLLGFLGVLEIFGFGSIANYAHLGGLISGLIFGMLVKILGKTVI